MERISNYTSLAIWQKAIELVTEVYKLTKEFPASEKLGLSIQINRASVAIPATIAEGWEKSNTDNYACFLKARGSVNELSTLLHISCKLAFIREETKKKFLDKIAELSNMISSMITSILKSGNPQQFQHI